MQPYFSVIVATYRRPQQLAACLGALARLGYPRERFEVIVVDDGDTTPADTLAPFRAQMKVKMLKQAHAGPAAARNLGASRAVGEFFAFTDDDCMPAPDWLDALAARFAATPELLVGGHTFNALEENLYSSASQTLVDYLCSYYNRDATGHALFFTGSNLALRAEGFRAAGGFDENFTLAAGEDRELCDRWHALGGGMVYAPEVVVYHGHDMTFKGFCRQHFNYGRGAVYFHRSRARRKQARVRMEPLSFYLDLLRYPFAQANPRRRFTLSALFALSQTANACGFFYEQARIHKLGFRASRRATN